MTLLSESLSSNTSGSAPDTAITDMQILLIRDTNGCHCQSTRKFKIFTGPQVW